MHGDRSHIEGKEEIQLGLGWAEEGEMDTASQSQFWPGYSV